MVFNNDMIHCTIFIPAKNKQVPAILQLFKVIFATIYIYMFNPINLFDSLGEELKNIRLAAPSTIIL